MKIENSHFYNMEPVIDLEHFVELLLVTLANRTSLFFVNINETTKKNAILHPNYKEQIEKAMYSENALQFLQLIDSYQYYERQASWEMELSNCMNKYLNNKNWKYNFEHDYIEIEFTIDEIKKILAQYEEKTKNTMVNLLNYNNTEYLYPDIRYIKLIDKNYKREINRAYIKNYSNFSNTWTDKEEIK